MIPGRLHRLLAPLLTVQLAGTAAAMQFQQGTTKDGDYFISAEGEIHNGDLQQFQRALASVPAGKRLAGVLLDSPGGSLSEGARLADQIHDSGLTVLVTSHSQCASACFLMLAASPHRVAGVNALVGVHSASIEGGRETTDTMAMTLRMQRVAADYGVPPVILGKIAQTTPGHIEWLTHDDLAAMDVKFLDDASDADAPARAPTPVAVAEPGPVPGSDAGAAAAAAADGAGARRCRSRPSSRARCSAGRERRNCRCASSARPTTPIARRWSALRRLRPAASFPAARSCWKDGSTWPVAASICGRRNGFRRNRPTSPWSA